MGRRRLSVPARSRLSVPARSRFACIAVLAVIAVVAGATRVDAATSTLLEPGVPRVLMISTPGVGWSLINPSDTPNLWRLFEGSAVGNLTARTIGRTDLASGYLTMGAGTRATAPRSPLDGAGMEPSEQFGDVTARDAFFLNTGRVVDDGVVQLGLEPILAANADERVEATIGGLGEVLADAGYARAVIGNGDGAYPDQTDVLRRYAVNGLMTGHGVVPAGRAGGELLREDPDAPFGIRFDADAVAAAFDDAWQQDSVVLVEMSDLVRADAFGLLSTPEQGAAALRQALIWTDALVGRLLAAVDFDRDAVVVVSPIRARNTVLSAVAVHAPGLPAGLLTSASTRRPGFVLLADVAPTVLGLAGVPRDRDMTGSRFTVGRARPLTTRLDALETSTDASVFHDQVRGPVTLGYTVLLAVVLGGAAWAMSRDQRLRRWRTALTIGALSSLTYVPVVFLARVFPLHEAGTAAYWGFLVVASIGAAVAIRAATRGRAGDAALAALGLIVTVLVIDVLTGARLQLNSAFGYSATVGIRVAGYGNVAYAMLGSAAVLVSALLAHRVGGRRGAWFGCAVMAVALVVDVAPFWGSDVGGVLSLVPAFGVTALLLLGARIRLTFKATAIAVAVTALVLAAVTAFDLSRPADARTHLGRLAQQVADEGLTPFAVTIERKVDANLDTWSSSDWRLVLLVTVAFVAYLFLRRRDRVRQVVETIPELRAALVGIAVLALLGYAVNDSGVMIPAAALAVTSATFIVLIAGDTRRGGGQPGDTTSASTDSVVAAAVSHE